MTVMDRVKEHYNEALTYFPENRIVGIFLQGSQNYGLATPQSDVDTKLIVTPTFKDIAMNRKPVSTTHIRTNEEHIDFKDIRLYIQTFRKQNLNFLEILYTDFAIVNPIYEKQWNRLVESREAITHFNPYRSVQSMKGIALEKYHAMEHEYPSKIEVLKKYGYDPKQLHHLIRVEDYLGRYINGESYESCLDPGPMKQELIEIKMGKYSLADARSIADKAKAHVEEMAEYAYSIYPNEEDPEVNELLDDVQYEIMRIAVKGELG